MGQLIIKFGDNNFKKERAISKSVLSTTANKPAFQEKKQLSEKVSRAGPGYSNFTQDLGENM